MPAIKPVLIVIAGPNGSGKTEITKVLRSKYNWADGLVEINPDNIAQEEFGGWNDRSAVIKAADKADAIREQCLADKQGLLFETVLSTPQKVSFIERAKKAGFFIRLIYVATISPEINYVRVKWRHWHGGHDVPKEKILSRYKRSLKFAVKAARLADRSYFVDNSTDADDAALGINPFTVFRAVNGVVAKAYVAEEDFPRWTKPIYRALQRGEG